MATKKFINKSTTLVITIILAAAALLYVFSIRNHQDLEVWHKIDLSKEVTATDIKLMSSLEDYINKENILFDQLEEHVYKKISVENSLKLNRYRTGSWSNPNRFKKNWNRTIELPAKNPKAGVLMLHGMSDSPYSMRSLALELNSDENWIVALRLPGHGTVPSGLRHAQWQDFSEAVRLAARHLSNRIGPDKPFYIVGYSNGGALALEYTLSEMLGERLNRPAGLILISPAIAVPPTGLIASSIAMLAQLPGLEKLAWLSIKQEYDPYKYNSFAVNAGAQVYKLTKRINGQLKKLDQGAGVKNFPPTLAFQSTVDSTLSPHGLIDKFMNRLSPNGHKLVIFDINQMAAETIFLKNEFGPTIEKMMAERLPFTLSLLTNKNKNSKAMEIRNKGEMEIQVTAESLKLTWPQGVYSLSHVALPFPKSDHLYGAPSTYNGSNFSLGLLEARGEKGVLQVPLSDLMRLRYNPFYDILESQVTGWVHSPKSAESVL